jgi:hypothetical protein
MKLLHSVYLLLVTAVPAALCADVLKAGPMAGLDLETVAADVRQMIVAANEDCIEVEAYRLPKHAEPFPMVHTDGGSRAFIGDGYVLFVRQSFAGVDEKNPTSGYLYGYELYCATYEALQKNGRRSPEVARVWYVPAARIDAMNKANAAELKARMPPREKYLRLEADGETMTEKSDGSETRSPKSAEGNARDRR